MINEELSNDYDSKKKNKKEPEPTNKKTKN